MDDRIEYVDYVKGIMIFLMVMFHIHYVDAIQPWMSFVYAFHMPVFLFFSGLFVKTNKPLDTRFRNVFRTLLVPYLFFELLYISSLYVAGKMGFSFQNSISEITSTLLLNKLLLAPIGAYWYLHTLIICLVTTYIVDHFVKNALKAIIFISLFCFIVSTVVEGFHFSNCIFFVIGYYFRRFKITIPLQFTSIIPFVLIGFLSFTTVTRASIESLGLVLFSISFLGWFHEKNPGSFLRTSFSYLGRNTLIIVVLHPLFLNLFKMSYKYFSLVDKSGLLYSLIATTFTILASLISSYIFDKIKVSKILFGRFSYSSLR